MMMTCSAAARTVGVALIGVLSAWVAAAEKPAWQDRPLPAWKPVVSADVVKLDGGAEIQWKPLPFQFQAGESVRYIDYASGDDANSGQTHDQAWKHHPWDAHAAANAKAAEGVQTYVFKRGVVYRGALVADESGKAEEPIRLTSDPSWGEGEATIAGSHAITGGWQKLPAEEAAAAGFPQPSRDKLWYVDVDGDFIPWALWVASGDSQRQRLPIARWPNWKIEHEYNHFTQWFRVEKIEKGFPRTTIYAPKVLNDPDPDAFKGATVWMDHANTSGEFSIIGPFPSAAAGYDPKTGALEIAITHPRRHPHPNAPFYLENLARFLDEGGEWFFSRSGDHARRLYIRLPDDADPNQRTVEIAQHPVILDIRGQQHIDVSGLTFTGGNARDLNDAPRAGDWERPDNYTQMAAIRLNNNTQHVRLHHLNVRDTAGSGVVHLITEENTVLRDVEIADSQCANIDNEAIHFRFQAAPVKNPSADLMDIRILRNRLHEIGLRSSSDQGGRGIDLTGLNTGQIAGNVVSRTGGQGINVVGARMGADVPLVRIQIARNQVRDTLLQKQDFGGIEFWGVGPAYVYNNISINPVGLVTHRNVYHKNHAYYFDHGAKGYLFNNIGWSDKREDAYRGILGDYFFHEIRNQWNQAFHNSALNFRSAMTHSSRHGSQQHYLANLLINARSGSSHWTLNEAAEIAFANNLYAGEFVDIYHRWKGETFHTVEQYREHVKDFGNVINKHYGWATDDMPIVDPQQHDFRLTDDSAAIDRGVKVFVPWSLYGTVGEWHFRLHPKDANAVLGYDAYPQPHHLHHEQYRRGSTVPNNDLIGTSFTAEHYQAGVLEDWVPGAITFDGSRKMSLPNERLVQDFNVAHNKTSLDVAGRDRKTVRMTDNNFLIEAVFRAEPRSTAGTLAAKLGDDAGYALVLDEHGRLVMRLRTGGQEITQASAVAVNDGRWHHVIAEVDRAAGRIMMYMNGVAANGSTTGTMPAAGASLDNAADFVVGEGFTGALDYLRISRGTLADAQTTIDELMAWQFNGPAQHDFVDRPPTGGVRDIGALEHPTATGQKPIRYTPPAVAADAENTQEADAFRKGEDRTVKTTEWGAVSVPRTAKAGDAIDVQVVFGTETIAKEQILQIDLHGFVGRERKPGLAQANPIKVTPGVTTPYVATLKIRPREGLSAVAAVIYVSPDGTRENKILAAEVSIPLSRDNAPATAPAKADSQPVQPDAQNKAKPAPAVQEGDSVTMKADWGIVSMTANPAVEQEVVVTVTLAEGVPAEPTVLNVDLHWWQGTRRMSVLGKWGTRKVQPGATGPFVFKKVLPRKEGLSAVAAVVSLSPDGSWKNKTHSTEVSARVK